MGDTSDEACQRAVNGVKEAISSGQNANLPGHGTGDCHVPSKSPCVRGMTDGSECACPILLYLVVPIDDATEVTVEILNATYQSYTLSQLGLDKTSWVTCCLHCVLKPTMTSEKACQVTLDVQTLIDTTAGPFGEIEEDPQQIPDAAC